ncbi:MAG: hypothetical protein KF681_17625 [Bdellovibrionaceae bacterium]|nr:hypothetical protein [Pseudobdellovibrionaceae bacterium]
MNFQLCLDIIAPKGRLAIDVQKVRQVLHTVMLAIAAFTVFALVSTARAQTPTTTTATSNATVVSKKERKTSLNFEDELVEGATTKPELFYLFQKKNFNYKRLIRLRENFLPEMRKTSEDISRARSSN